MKHDEAGQSLARLIVLQQKGVQSSPSAKRSSTTVVITLAKAPRRSPTKSRPKCRFSASA
jgi:hypothetical protein